MNITNVSGSNSGAIRQLDHMSYLCSVVCKEIGATDHVVCSIGVDDPWYGLSMSGVTCEC